MLGHVTGHMTKLGGNAECSTMSFSCWLHVYQVESLIYSAFTKIVKILFSLSKLATFSISNLTHLKRDLSFSRNSFEKNLRINYFARTIVLATIFNQSFSLYWRHFCLEVCLTHNSSPSSGTKVKDNFKNRLSYILFCTFSVPAGGQDSASPHSRTQQVSLLNSGIRKS